MISIPKNYYSNLSCYEEFVIRTNILGYDVSNAKLYDLFEKKYCISDVNCIRIIKDFCFFAVGDDANRHLCIIDRKGNHIENAVIEGNFSCSSMDLTSLKGAPREVGGDFYCSSNNLTSLEGAPYKIYGDFYCFNNKLTDNQIKAYKKWLKTNPSSSYHDPYAT